MTAFSHCCVLAHVQLDDFTGAAKSQLYKNIPEIVHLVSYFPEQGRFWHWFISEKILRASLELISVFFSASVALFKFSKFFSFLLIYRFIKLSKYPLRMLQIDVCHFAFSVQCVRLQKLCTLVLVISLGWLNI